MGLTARERWEACSSDTGGLLWSCDVWMWWFLWVEESSVFDSSPAHSGLSSSKFTAKSCETFMWGREHRASYPPRQTKHSAEHVSPILVDRCILFSCWSKASCASWTGSKILSSQSSPCNCKNTRTLIQRVLPWSQVVSELQNQTQGTFYRWRKRESERKHKWWMKALRFMQLFIWRTRGNLFMHTFIKWFGPQRVNLACVCMCVFECVSALAKRWLMEWALPVIVLADLPYRHQRFEVLVGLVGVDVVEGAAVSGIPIGRCEVYRHLGQQDTHACAQAAWVGTNDDMLLLILRRLYVTKLTVNWIWQPPMM